MRLDGRLVLFPAGLAFLRFAVFFFGMNFYLRSRYNRIVARLHASAPMYRRGLRFPPRHFGSSQRFQVYLRIITILLII